LRRVGDRLPGLLWDATLEWEPNPWGFHPDMAMASRERGQGGEGEGVNVYDEKVPVCPRCIPEGGRRWSTRSGRQHTEGTVAMVGPPPNQWRRSRVDSTESRSKKKKS